ncbi:ribonuclease PH, partial [Candidatus Bathyarchaeota archaeon]|nr:ribonuclease PH [Candidatus Bathyarchaeota archaeon]
MTLRAHDELRNITFDIGFQKHPKGSVLIGFGNTRVLCSASVQPGAPRWKVEQDVPGGWVTSEYSMLPGSTDTRKPRPSGGRVDSRSVEIQRLIGRSLRAVVDMESIGPNSIYVDCDVIDADGGTRCASITGGAVALYQALRTLKEEGMIETIPMAEMVAAVSVGIKNGEVFLDLDYALDSTVDVDMNIVMTESGKLVEVQGTAEEQAFTRDQLNQMLDLAEKGIKEIIVAQKKALG